MEIALLFFALAVLVFAIGGVILVCGPVSGRTRRRVVGLFTRRIRLAIPRLAITRLAPLPGRKPPAARRCRRQNRPRRTDIFPCILSSQERTAGVAPIATGKIPPGKAVAGYADG